MSELGDLESAVVGLIAGIQDGGQPVFRAVAGYAKTDRPGNVSFIRSQNAPAALVSYEGRLRLSAVRGGAEASRSIVGLPRLTVWIRAQNQRGGDDVRYGDGSAMGGFELLALVMGVLDGAVVQTDRRLLAVEEQVAAADETDVIYEQRYVVDRVAELQAPTFNATALAGAESVVNVMVGPVDTATHAFAFPGIDGVFRHHLGTRGRVIRWMGQLRAASDAALNAVESNIEAAVGDALAHDVVDAWSRTFSECVLERFERIGNRRRHPVTGQAVQEFEMTFVQLNP